MQDAKTITDENARSDGGFFSSIKSVHVTVVAVGLLLALGVLAIWLQGRNAAADRQAIEEQQEQLAALLDPPALSVEAIEVLNRVDGVAGPAIGQGGLLHWTQLVCNPRTQTISSTIAASLVNVDSGETINFDGTVSANLPPGCRPSDGVLTIRMDKDVPPGQWRLRLLIFFSGVSDSIFGLSAPLEVVAALELTVIE